MRLIDADKADVNFINMAFKEFCAWCHERACDGCWSSDTAKMCCLVIATIQDLAFWKRESIWRRVNKELKIEELYVKPTDAMRKELMKRCGMEDKT